MISLGVHKISIRHLTDKYVTLKLIVNRRLNEVSLQTSGRKSVIVINVSNAQETRAKDRTRYVWCLRRCMCVMDSPALQMQRAIHTVKFVKSYATWQHRFDVDSDSLSYPSPLSHCYNFAQNVTSSSVGGSDYRPKISSKSVQYSWSEENADVGMEHRDHGT